ncbi:MAG: hypothetical protein R2834_24740, partial [Rhodothermales bacterium]
WQHAAGSMMLDQLLFTYTLTRDDRLLAPLKASLDLVARYRDAPAADALPAGSPQWAAAILRETSAFWSVVETWRLRTGDKTYDDLILNYGTPYARYRLSGDTNHLAAGLEDILDVVRFNVPLLTDQVLHTDRVYVARPNTPGERHLSAMLTGDGTPEAMSPYPVVTYSQLSATTAALVTDSSPSGFGIDLYETSRERKLVELRLWHLAPGYYQFRYYERGKEVRDLDLHVTRRGMRYLLSIPGQTMTRVEIEAKQ